MTPDDIRKLADLCDIHVTPHAIAAMDIALTLRACADVVEAANNMDTTLISTQILAGALARLEALKP